MDVVLLAKSFWSLIWIPIQGILALLLALLGGILDGITYVTPPEIQQSVNTAISYVFYLKEWFPVTSLLEVSLALLTLTTAVYSVKFGLWLLSFIPGTKIPQYFPTVSTTTEAEMTGTFSRFIGFRGKKLTTRNR